MYKCVYYVCAHVYIYCVNVYMFVGINVYILFICVCAYLCVNIHVHIYPKHILFPMCDIYQPFNANRHLEDN